MRKIKTGLRGGLFGVGLLASAATVALAGNCFEVFVGGFSTSSCTACDGAGMNESSNCNWISVPLNDSCVGGRPQGGLQCSPPLTRLLKGKRYTGGSCQRFSNGILCCVGGALQGPSALFYSFTTYRLEGDCPPRTPIDPTEP